MKFLSLLLLLPTFAYGQTCFKADSAVPADVPEVLCLDHLEETSTFKLIKVSSKDANFPKELQEMYRVFHNEDKQKVYATGNLVNKLEQMCSYYIKADVEVFSWYYSYQGYLMDTVELKVNISETYDNCHSKAEVYTVNYSKI